MAGYDIVEGRETRSIAFDIGLNAGGTWTNTNIAYDTAIGGMPFIYAINDQNPYIRQTAAFRKEQFDNQTEPGEQSLTGWWLRSQSSFHDGTGINYADPTGGDNNTQYRFNESKGVDVWTKGQVTLLDQFFPYHLTTEPIVTSGVAKGRSMQQMRSCSWVGSGTTFNAILFHDGYDVDKIVRWPETSGEYYFDNFIDYAAGLADKVYAICDDGTYAYWVTNDTSGPAKLQVLKKLLDKQGTDPNTSMFTAPGIVVQNAVMEYVKDRIVMCANNKIYEFASNATALPTALYTHSSTDVMYTGISASGTAIYVSWWNGSQSGIDKFTLASNGTMPTLTSAIAAAAMPPGEKIHTINYYLGYMLIGTSKGLRVATVDDAGSISYGPLSPATPTPVFQIATRNNFAYITAQQIGPRPTDSMTDVGLIRVDLSNQIDTLRFAWANDVFYERNESISFTPESDFASAVGFIGNLDELCFANPAKKQFAVTNKARTSNVVTLTVPGHNYTQYETIYVLGVDPTIDTSTIPYSGSQFRQITSVTTNTITFTAAGTNIASVACGGVIGTKGSVYVTQRANNGVYNPDKVANKVPTGYITTGKIRYNTLEPKNFKRLVARCTVDDGTLTLATIDSEGNTYNVITYGDGTPAVEVATNEPTGPQEYLSYKFTLNRDSTTPYTGPTLNGYQAKATIATKRQRVIRFPVFCFDTETDKYNNQVGYEGRAMERISALEQIESNGDIVTWQDLSSGEQRQCVIEQITFTRMTPPDRSFSGYGGIVNITIRTV